MAKKQVISVAFSCSEQYSPYLATMLVSLLTHLDPARKLAIYVLTEDFSEASKAAIIT